MFSRRDILRAPLGFAVGLGCGGSSSAPMIREVGTRSALSLLQAANTLKYNCRKSSFIRGSSIQGIQVAWANFCVNSGVETNSGGTLTVTASIEYPVSATPTVTPGTRTQLLFNGSGTGTVADGGVLKSDMLPINIPKDAQIRVWWTQQNSVGICYANGGPYQAVSALGDAQRQTASDFTLSGTFTDDSNTNILWMSRIMGLTTARSDIMIIGDSRNSGFGETPGTQDASGDCGELARPIGGTHAYFRLGQNGMQLLQFATTQHTKQDQLANLALPSYIILEGGANDLGIGRTASQIMGNIATIAARYPGIPIYIPLEIPRTTSSNNWTTTPAQTVLGTESERVALNNSLIANAPGYAGILNYRSTLANGTDFGIWNVTGSSGTAAYTPDGTHETALANKLISFSIP